MPFPEHPILFWLWVAAAVATTVYQGWRYVCAVRSRPRFTKEEIVFQEWFASGNSRKNLLTRIGGARNCLRLVVTRDFLWVTSWFPFSLFATFYDLEHVIPLGSITSVQPKRFLGRETFVLSFTMGNGTVRSLNLYPKKPEAFIQSLGVKLDADTAP